MKNLDIKDEIKKLLPKLKIPIENLQFDKKNGTVTIYSEGSLNMGKLNASDINREIIYDTSNAALQNLAWSELAVQEKEILLEKIKAVVPKANELTILGYGQVLSKDSSGNDLSSYVCEFDNEWSVREEK
jgi:hypothetical protein